MANAYPPCSEGLLSGILQVGFAGVDGVSQTREMATKGAAWSSNLDDELLFAESHKLSGGRVVATYTIRVNRGLERYGKPRTSVIRSNGDGIVQLEAEALSFDLVETDNVVGFMRSVKDQLASSVTLDNLWLLLVLLEVLVESANPLHARVRSNGC